jgi:hypothetical protein
VNTTERAGAIGRRRRRRHSAAFKAESVAACLKPGVSIVAVAMARSLNANLLRRWIVDAERQVSAAAPVTADPKPKPKPAPVDAAGFVPLALPPPSPPASASASGAAPTGDSTIRIKARRGATVVTVEWPPATARECGLWLRELLR